MGFPHQARRSWFAPGVTRRGAIGRLASLAIAGTVVKGTYEGEAVAASPMPDQTSPYSLSREAMIAAAQDQNEEGEAMSELTITHVNPESMHANPAFSQAVTVEGNAKTIYIGGQNAVGPDGSIVGEGDLSAQVVQTLTNLETVLEAAGATKQDVVKWTIFVLQGQDVMTGFTAFQEHWGPMEKAPAITSAFVAALANPAFLVEIEAIAVVAAGG